jgi:hypothetical protein
MFSDENGWFFKDMDFTFQKGDKILSFPLAFSSF